MSELKIIWHGSYGRKTIYDIVQHRYASTDCEAKRQGYAEVLEIKNPPPGKCGQVIHLFFNDTGSIVHEFKYWEDALAAYRRMLNTMFEAPHARNKQGYLRTVIYTADELPWFYQD